MPCARNRASCYAAVEDAREFSNRGGDVDAAVRLDEGVEQGRLEGAAGAYGVGDLDLRCWEGDLVLGGHRGRAVGATGEHDEFRPECE